MGWDGKEHRQNSEQRLLFEFLEKQFDKYEVTNNAAHAIIMNKIDCINGVKKDISRIDKDIERNEKWMVKGAYTLLGILIFLAAYHGTEFIKIIWH